MRERGFSGDKEIACYRLDGVADDLGMFGEALVRTLGFPNVLR